MEFIKPKSGKTSKVVELGEVMGKFVNDIQCKFSFGFDVNSLDNPEMYKMAHNTFCFKGELSKRFFLVKNFRNIARMFKITLFNNANLKFYENLVKGCVDTRMKSGVGYNDCMQMLIQTMNDPNAKLKLKLFDIQSEITEFFFGGFDTTCNYLCFVLYLLAREPEIQQKLQSEIDEVVKVTDGKMTFEDVNHMKYLNAVIVETGRMYNPVTFFSRRCTKRFELPPAMPGMKPFVIEEGMNVTFPILALNWDGKLYPEPDKFYPERFLRDNVPNERYLAFGLGPRMCLGMRLVTLQMKLMVVHLLAEYNLKILRGSENLELDTSCWLLTLKNGFWVEIQNRGVDVS